MGEPTRLPLFARSRARRELERRPGGSPRKAVALLASVALSAALASCAGRQADLHLSPLFSNLSSAGGGREIEALAGIVRVRRPEPEAEMNEWAVRPLVSERFEPNGDALMRFLVPLGTRRTLGDEFTFQLLPIVRYQRNRDELGREQWKLMALPGIFWSQEHTGRVARAFFPFGGVIENFLTYDRITFVLFPLFIKTERAGRTSWHFLWPIFNYGSGGGSGTSHRVWPLYGVAQPRSYDRRFWLWPFFHYHRDYIRRAPEQVETRWMFWPFLGRTRRGSYRATTVLWPFFGWGHNPETGFWAWDGPWPFVRFMRQGERPRGGAGSVDEDAAERTRVWPFYSHYVGDGLESTWYAWPIYSHRVETYADGVRKGRVVLPFWQEWERFDLEARTTDSWHKLWPLYQRRVAQESERAAFPALNPLWHTPVIDDHYAFVYELYTFERQGTRVRERSWGGIWRRERDENERRTYLAGLWSRRSFTLAEGTVKEYSLCFGLLRWRSRPGASFRLLPPAMPGPGWPASRAKELAH